MADWRVDDLGLTCGDQPKPNVGAGDSKTERGPEQTHPGICSPGGPRCNRVFGPTAASRFTPAQDTLPQRWTGGQAHLSPKLKQS